MVKRTIKIIQQYILAKVSRIKIKYQIKINKNYYNKVSFVNIIETAFFCFENTLLDTYEIYIKLTITKIINICW